MALATLSIDLVAKLAKFEEDLGRAARISEQQAAAIEKAFSRVKTAVAGLGIAGIVTAQINSVRTAIDGLDKIDELSEKYGIASTQLAAYSYASEVAGTTTEAFAAGLNKLAKNMTAAVGGSREQAAAFKAMGVDLKGADGSLRSLDDVLLEVADRFSNYEDGPEKAALAMTLFGKSGVDLLPVLNKGKAGIQELMAEARQLGLVMGGDAYKAAGDFNDNMLRLSRTLDALKVQIASDVLPTITRFTNELLEGRKAFGSWTTALVELGIKTNPFDTYAESAAKARASVGELRNAIQNVRDKAKRGDYTDADRQFIEASEQQLAVAERRLKYFSRMEELTASTSVPEGMKDTRGGTPSRDAAPVLDSKAAAAAEAAEKSYRKLIESITQRGELARAELANNGKLDEADKFRIDTLAKLNLAENGYTAAMKKAGAAAIERTARDIEALDARERIRAATEAAAAAEQASIRAVEEAIEGRRGENNTLRDQIALFGMTAEQIEQVRIRRLQEALAVEQGEIAIARAQGAGAGELILMQQKARLLEQQIELRQRAAAQQSAQDRDPMLGASKAITDYLETVGKAGEATRQAVAGSITTLENDLTQSLVSQKPSIRNFVDTVIAEMYRLTVVRPMLKSLFGDSGAGGLFGSFFKAMGGGSGGGGGAGLIDQLTEYGVFAKGGAFDIAGARPFAAGGVFDSPHFFKFAQGSAMHTGVMGEAGPEAIMPLRRGADGKLGVVAQGSGRSIVLSPSIAVYIDARTDQAVIDQKVAQGVQSGMRAVMDQLSAEGVR